MLKEKVINLFQNNEKMSVLQAAKELGVREFDILTNLNEDVCKVVDVAKFDEIMQDIQNWGEVLFVKNTPSFVIEIKTTIPSGKYSHGYYNFDMKECNFGGHLKVDDIDKILFVSTKFMSMLGHSVQFYDKNGENIFKIYVARDEKRMLKESQVNAFLNLKAKF